MLCPECHSENPATNSFCRECGSQLSRSCPNCGVEISHGDKFCGKCGHALGEPTAEEKKPDDEVESERKHVTVFFSDLSGYTAMNEKLDPEEVKEIMSRIFGEIAQVITKYEGFIERFIGDAVMAIFGVPKAHEDDPVRAIKAANEIHALVENLSPQFEDKIGRSLSMHSGINTGLVVTGKVDLEKGTQGLTGDAINVAARLQDLAISGEILVGYETYRQTEGYFEFEKVKDAKVKGKLAHVLVYRLLNPKDRPVTVHRLSGLRADLIGRTIEMEQLHEALQKLKGGTGSVFAICGDAGTGKSRLVEDFKSSLDLDEIQFLKSNAFAYAQNIPYFPLIDLLSRILQIKEVDPPEAVRGKVHSGVMDLIGEQEHIIPIFGSLYSLNYPEQENVSPELWKNRLQEGVKAILTALAQRMPTIFFLEDLHWADASFLDLLRHELSEVYQPALVIYTYRPPFSLLSSQKSKSLSTDYHEIWLKDLSPSETQAMVSSLLKTDTLPYDLKQFFQQKTEGNPFYLEEVVNSLVESEALVRDDGKWRLTRQIGGLDISSTVHGVISARLDRLEKQTKRILQEASVIGRTFLYNILKRITELTDQIDGRLSGLERLDLIRTKALEPDLEYIFKHALTQEVVYKGLLKKERQEIHEKIGLVMEKVFKDRLPEFYETLAFHFKEAKSDQKAIFYMSKSGERSFQKSALDESHQYFKS